MVPPQFLASLQARLSRTKVTTDSGHAAAAKRLTCGACRVAAGRHAIQQRAALYYLRRLPDKVAFLLSLRLSKWRKPASVQWHVHAKTCLENCYGVDMDGQEGLIYNLVPRKRNSPYAVVQHVALVARVIAWWGSRAVHPTFAPCYQYQVARRWMTPVTCQSFREESYLALPMAFSALEAHTQLAAIPQQWEALLGMKMGRFGNLHLLTADRLAERQDEHSVVNRFPLTQQVHVTKLPGCMGSTKTTAKYRVDVKRLRPSTVTLELRAGCFQVKE